jgi:hypothetical protein
MNAPTDELATRLALVVPELDEPDWLDVVARSGLLRPAVPPRRRGHWFAPRVLAFAILVVLAGGSLALAFGGNVLDAFRSSPAPAPIERQFKQFVRPPLPLDGAPPHSAMNQGTIVKNSQQRVLGVPTSIGTVATLYVARTTNGSTCIDLVGKPIGFKGCTATMPGAFPIRAFQHSWHYVDRPPRRQGREFVLLGTVAAASVTTVRVVYADGTHHDIPVTDRWYGYEVPQSEATKRLAPLRLEARTAAGAVVGTLRHPLGTLNVAQPIHFTAPTVSHVHELARSPLPNDGGTVTIASGRDTTGQLCFRHLRNGKSQTNIWDCSAAVGAYGYTANGAHIPIYWDMGLRNDPHHPTGYGYAYAWGWVPPGSTSLTVRFQGGGSHAIPLHQRFYLYVVPPSHWPAGTRPSILDARDAAGTVVSSRFLYPRQHCIYPGRDPLCKNIGYGTG